MIDKIFIINLNERVDRWNYIKNHLLNLNIINFERIVATKLDFDSTISKIKLAQISCFHSHLKTLRKAKSLELNNVLILEDDCYFINYKPLDNIITKYDILYFGCNRKIYKNNNTLVYLSEIENVNADVVKITECGTTHAILYSRKIINRIIDMYPNDEIFFQKAFTLDEKYSTYDIFLNWFTQECDIQKYCVNPIMCTQIESYSDIQFCNVNYNDEIINSWL